MKNLKDYYNIGDKVCDVRFGEHGIVLSVSKLSVTIKTVSSKVKTTLRSLKTVDEFYKSHPVI